MKRFLASLLRARWRLDPDLETRKVACESLPSGQDFPPNYEPLRRLGGRQAAVYLARHVRSSAQVVVKTLQTTASDSDIQRSAQADRVRREAAILSQCSHENLVACLEAGELSQPPNPVPYFVMPFVSGVNLFEHIRTHGPLPQAKAVVVLGQLCAALSALHAGGWLHCDLAPKNVMLIVDAEVGVLDRVKLIDLGIARPVAATAEADSQPGTYGSIQGSPSFMSPEACRGSRQLTIQSDVYGLGCLAYFLLTSRLPFSGATSVEICWKQLHAPLPVFPAEENQVPIAAELRRLVLQCLSKVPQERPCTPQQLADRLRHVGSVAHR